MASFLTELWESIFTPGPTPTLLIAANASFGALQLVLLLLFVATYSAHFIALSLICAGVWWGINWFAVELRKAQLAEEEAAKLRKEKRDAVAVEVDGTAETSGGEGGDEEEDDETETEKEVQSSKGPGFRALRVRGGPQKIRNVLASAGYDPDALRTNTETAETSGTQGPNTDSGMSRRKAGKSTSADLSVSGTDSEWEKVSEGDKAEH